MILSSTRGSGAYAGGGYGAAWGGSGLRALVLAPIKLTLVYALQLIQPLVTAIEIRTTPPMA